MSRVEFEQDAVRIDAAIIAAGFAIEPALVQPLMHEGQITSLCERGLDRDAGNFRLTFFMAGVACASSLMRQAMSSSVRWPTSAGVAIALRGASRPLSAANGKPCDHPLIRPSAAHHAAYRSRLDREFDSRMMDRQRMRSPL